MTEPHDSARRSIPAVLTIAGSDSGGGAGIQADLKTFRALGVFGVSAITCITAQNPDTVAGVEPVSPLMVALQIGAVCDGFPVAAVKTGMLYSREIVEAVAAELTARGLKRIVVDPVMVSTSGAKLLCDDAVAALTGALFPLATAITPNLPEAEALLGRRIADPHAMREAARELARRFGTAVVLKGGHLDGDRIVDMLCDGESVLECEVARVAAAETHGTGCTFSAALAALLARGQPLAEAVRQAQTLVVKGLAQPFFVGTHRPLGV
jgi:hydroxymethylpyrimidine/phosphomethylpyrimidine kinase